MNWEKLAAMFPPRQVVKFGGMHRGMKQVAENRRLVGAVRFELTTPCAQGRCATRLRYAPTRIARLILNHFYELNHRRDSNLCPHLMCNYSETVSSSGDLSHWIGQVQ